MPEKILMLENLKNEGIPSLKIESAEFDMKDDESASALFRWWYAMGLMLKEARERKEKVSFFKALKLTIRNYEKISNHKMLTNERAFEIGGSEENPS